MTESITVNVHLIPIDPTKSYFCLIRGNVSPEVVYRIGQELRESGIKGIVMAPPDDVDVQIIEQQEDVPPLFVRESSTPPTDSVSMPKGTTV